MRGEIFEVSNERHGEEQSKMFKYYSESSTNQNSPPKKNKGSTDKKLILVATTAINMIMIKMPTHFDRHPVRYVKIV